MELWEAIHERRSIRKFLPEPVRKEVLEDLLRKSLWAPSGMNRQAWKYIVVQGNKFEELLKISSNVAELMDGPLKAQQFNEKMQTLVKGYFKNLGGAQTAIICLSKTASTELADGANFLSAGAAFQNFLLLAHEAGLATCWMTGYVTAEKEFLNWLGAEDYRLVGVTPVGYPDQTPPIPPRKGDPIEWME